MIWRTYFAEVRETPRRHANSESAQTFGVLAGSYERIQWILTIRDIRVSVKGLYHYWPLPGSGFLWNWRCFEHPRHPHNPKLCGKRSISTQKLPTKKKVFFQKSFFRRNFHFFRDLKIQKIRDLADLAMCTSHTPKSIEIWGPYARRKNGSRRQKIPENWKNLFLFFQLPY